MAKFWPNGLDGSDSNSLLQVDTQNILQNSPNLSSLIALTLEITCSLCFSYKLRKATTVYVSNKQFILDLEQGDLFVIEVLLS